MTVVGRNSSNGECRECAREYARKKYGYKCRAEDWISHCRKGHLRTEENTRTARRVRRGKELIEKVCLDCRKAALERYEAKRGSRSWCRVNDVP